MVTSQQISTKKDAEKYYQLLDADKNGSVSFSEFLAPILPQLTKDQVNNLTKNSRYSCDDLTMLREIYAKLRQEESIKLSKAKNNKRKSEFNKDFQMKLKHSTLKTAVDKKKIASLKKAFKAMEDILPGKDKTEFINDQTFS